MADKSVPSSGNTGPRDFSDAVHSQFASGGIVGQPPSFTGMRVGAARDGKRPVTIEFDAGSEDPVEVMEAFERMLASWPDARVPLKIGAAKGGVCGCGTDHGGWTCSHCTRRSE